MNEYEQMFKQREKERKIIGHSANKKTGATKNVAPFPQIIYLKES